MFGYSLAIGCALCWAISIIMFRFVSSSISPASLNLLKNLTGFALMIPTAIATDGLSIDIATDDWLILFISGGVGIGIADALVLKALEQLGASRLAILECLYSPFVITLSMLFLGERFNMLSGFGAGLVLLGIAIAALSKTPKDSEFQKQGFLWGGLGLFLMAIGIVLFKPLLAVVPLFWLITIRLFAGCIMSFFYWIITTNTRRELSSIKSLPNKPLTAAACVMSTYIAMMMWVAAFGYNEAMTTAVLNQTSTFFTVLLAALILKEKLTTPKIIATMTAASGAILIAVS